MASCPGELPANAGISTLAIGDPIPVTRSYPGPAEKPLFPVTTSWKSLDGSEYNIGSVCVAPFNVPRPASTRPWLIIAIIPAHEGDARLVPPTCVHGADVEPE